MRRGCWRGNVILVFKCMKDYYCFRDADSSEPSLLYHFPGLLIYSFQSFRPSRKWISPTCPPPPPHYSHPTVSVRLCSVPHLTFTPIFTQLPHSTFPHSPPAPSKPQALLVTHTKLPWPGVESLSHQPLTVLSF